MKTAITIMITIALLAGCDSDPKSEEFRSAECTVTEESLTVEYSVDGFLVDTPTGCSGEVYLDVDDLTLLSLDGVGIVVVDEIDDWTKIAQDCDPTSQSCPPSCNPQTQSCPPPKPEIWVKTTPQCCPPYGGQCKDCW